MTKRLEVGDVSYQFQIWDTAGQEKVGIARTAKNKIIKKKKNNQTGNTIYNSFHVHVSFH